MKEISKTSGGKNESAWIKNHCTCGWKGKAHFAYEDMQRTNVNREASAHRCPLK